VLSPSRRAGVRRAGPRQSPGGPRAARWPKQPGLPAGCPRRPGTGRCRRRDGRRPWRL